jgi:hypothetical protein
MPQNKDSGIFSPAPRQDHCCLCGTQQGPFVREERRTGPGLSLQIWPHCRACWEQGNSDAANNEDPHVIVKWVSFLEAMARGELPEMGDTSVQG